MRIRDVKLQAIEERHWHSIWQIQRDVFIDVSLEPENVLKSKADNSPETCFVATQGEKVMGYVLSHGWSGVELPKLNRVLATCASSEYLYLHDLAVSVAESGRGVGKMLVHRLLQVADGLGYSRILLVAVNQADDFWARFGFAHRPEIEVDLCYGQGAAAMSLEL